MLSEAQRSRNISSKKALTMMRLPSVSSLRSVCFAAAFGGLPLHFVTVRMMMLFLLVIKVYNYQNYEVLKPIGLYG